MRLSDLADNVRIKRGGPFMHLKAYEIDGGSLALATGPELLLLDEPTAGMSPWETERTAAMVQDLARAELLTVLFSEHDTDVVFGISERITVMHRGRVIAEGLPEEIRRNPEVGAVYLGTEA